MPSRTGARAGDTCAADGNSMHDIPRTGDSCAADGNPMHGILASPAAHFPSLMIPGGSPEAAAELLFFEATICG